MVASNNGTAHDVNPAAEMACGQITLASIEDVDKAVAAAKLLFLLIHPRVKKGESGAIDKAWGSSAYGGSDCGCHDGDGGARMLAAKAQVPPEAGI